MRRPVSCQTGRERGDRSWGTCTVGGAASRACSRRPREVETDLRQRLARGRAESAQSVPLARGGLGRAWSAGPTAVRSHSGTRGGHGSEAVTGQGAAAERQALPTPGGHGATARGETAAKGQAAGGGGREPGFALRWRGRWSEWTLGHRAGATPARRGRGAGCPSVLARPRQRIAGRRDLGGVGSMESAF